MIRKIAETIKGLSLEGSFSNIPTLSVKSDSFRSDTLGEAMRNTDQQKLRYKAKKKTPPVGIENPRMDVKQHKRMANMKDERILEP